MTERRSPLEEALDLLLYAPLGLALTARDEVPKLAAKGRAQLSGQVNMAKMVGQFAVAQARKDLERRFGRPAEAPAPSSAASSADDEVPETALSEPAVDGTGPELVGGSSRVRDSAFDGIIEASVNGVSGSSPGAAKDLAIPGYDSLSASQVVQRLAGLSNEELAAVGEYESRHRRRRTILNRVSQLQEG